MSQLFGECDFGIARETRRRFDARILLLQFNLGHDAFLDAYRTPAIEMSCQNRAWSRRSENGTLPRQAKCKHSRHRRVVVISGIRCVKLRRFSAADRMRLDAQA